tara:strand:- start:437 stop:586 length:150 start_codon:yes stop_codon:yes gene_type:complete
VQEKTTKLQKEMLKMKQKNQMANLNQFKKQFKDKAVVSNNIKVFTVSIG